MAQKYTSMPSMVIADKEKNDYISWLMRSGQIKNNIFKLGAEYRLFKKWVFRSGLIFYKNEIDSDLLIFSEFLPQNTQKCLTYGLAYLNGRFESELYGFFGRQRPEKNKDNKRRDQAGIVFSMKIFK